MNSTTEPTRPDRIGVLFVCLGNICRSPLAEGIFIHLARERGLLDRFDIDSCGTGAWHVGHDADSRSIRVAAKYAITLAHEARQLEPHSDFARFHLLLPMDRSNMRGVLAAGSRYAVNPGRVRLMRSFDPTHLATAEIPEVPDPYEGADDGFERVFHMLHRACGGLLDRLSTPNGLDSIVNH
ncbi:MAG: low molecular weight phosphotyrosine protein phosphatase [Phycisphaerales bacterium]|nr:low molecular weight phosphotyrosine protein phosphatase [Phycisphaerales bacterium]